MQLGRFCIGNPLVIGAHQKFYSSDFHLDPEVLKINLFGHSFFVITLECQAGGDGRGARRSFVAPICGCGR